MSKFYVLDTFALESRKLFVLAGSVIDGDLRPGQLVRVPLNGGVAIEARIEAVEFARRSPQREDVCICISYCELGELEFWQSLNINNEEVEVVADISK